MASRSSRTSDPAEYDVESRNGHGNGSSMYPVVMSSKEESTIPRYQSQEGVRRRREFKGRHIQMMALGTFFMFQA